MSHGSPHYSLEFMKGLIRRGQYRVTFSAQNTAMIDFELFDAQSMLDCVLAIRGDDFYKTMKSHQRDSLWQDVYRPVIRGIAAYVKLQIADDKTVVISFKRK